MSDAFLARCIAGAVADPIAEFQLEHERWRQAESPLAIDEWLGMKPEEYTLVLAHPAALQRLIAGYQAELRRPVIALPDDRVGMPPPDLEPVYQEYRALIRDSDLVIVQRGRRQYQTIKDRQMRKCSMYLTTGELADRLEASRIEPCTKILWIRRID